MDKRKKHRESSEATCSCLGAMKPKVILTDKNMKMFHTVFNELEAIANVVTTENDEEETLRKKVEDADLLIVCYAQVTRKVLKSAKKLKGVLKWGVGVDSIDLDAATERRIPVVHCPSYGSDTVADHAFGLMIALARKIIDYDREMREKSWMWPSTDYAGIDLSGKKIGLIGFGRIGKAMACRCSAFGMNIVVYDPYEEGRSKESDNIVFIGLDELLECSDFVSIHCVLTPETNGLIGEKEFARMKSSAFLINVSRGAIVDEASLIKALKTRRIAGAGLDVFAIEPLHPDHPLLQVDNTILSPHFAYFTSEANERLDREALQAAINILQDRALENIKNPEIL